MTAVMEFVVYVAIVVAVSEGIEKIWKRRQRKLDLELEQLEREALDATIRWAYSHGVCRTFGEDYDVVVQEFRVRWGDERREVRR